MSLPTPTTSLIGRAEEVARVIALLEGHQLVTLTGAGGTGKTRVALAVADVYARDSNGDVIVVPLAAVMTPDRVPATIAAALGVREPAHGTTLDALIVAITHRQLLLVLDNLEQVVEAAPDLGSLLAACPSLRMLVTSRVPLRLSTEHLVVVPPLGLPDRIDTPAAALASEAVQLFAERARRVRAGFTVTTENVSTVVALCRRLDGLPLAIELAAARVRHLSPAAILERMDRQLLLLTGGPRDVPTRQQTMEAAIAWSYDLLTPGQQQLFRQLAVFPGGWTLEAAETVVAADLDVLGGLSDLVDHSLALVVDHGGSDSRYRMLEPIREYAVEQFRISEQVVTVQQRMAHFFSKLVEAGEPATYWAPVPDTWLRTCALEHTNLRAALDWYLEHQPVGALKLASSLYWFWRMHGHMTEGRRWLGDALRLSIDPPAIVRAKALAALGDLACWQSDFDQANRAYEESLALYLACEEMDGVGRTRYGLARSAQFSGDLQLARERYEACTSFYATIADPGGVRSSQFNLAATVMKIGDLDRAAQLYAEATMQSAEQDSATYVIGLVNLAGLAVLQRDWVRVVRYARDALRLFDVAADRLHIIEAIEQIATVLGETGQPLRAARLWGTADAERQRIGYDVPPDERDHKASIRATIARHLSREVFEAELARGRSMPIEDGITDALKVELPESTPSSSSPSTLSKREFEVLRGLVAGKTNQEIAADLYISPNTVTNHVTNILNKLGLDSRTAAATYAVRHGLV